MRITMKKLSASPEGALEAGHTYDVTRARARGLIEAGAAVAADEDPATGGRRSRPKPPAPPADPEGGDKGGDDTPLEKRTVDQLRQYAQENEIDLGDAVKKAHVFEAIQAAERARAEESGGE